MSRVAARNRRRAQEVDRAVDVDGDREVRHQQCRFIQRMEGSRSLRLS